MKARNVKALVVGGYAVAFHGRPRFTKDIDVFIEPSPDNAERLLRALADFGFGGLGLTTGDFSSPGKIVQLGVAFGDAWAHRVPGSFGTATVDYIGFADLIRNKQTSARPQDLLDVEDLTAEGE